MPLFRHAIRESGGPARRRPRRRARCLLLALGGLVLAGAAWIAVTGILARDELLAAQHQLAELRDPAAAGMSSADLPEPDKPTFQLEAAATHAERAHHFTTGPAWYLAAHIPVLGDPLRTVRGAAWAADRVTTEVLPPLVSLASDLGDDARGGGHINLAALRGATPDLDRAARTAADTRTHSARLPHHTWLPGADRARTELAGRLDRLVPATADAVTAARMFPAMLGEQAQRRYLVVFQNSAEARGTGGLPGAFAVLTASRGRLAFEDFGNDTEMAHARAEVDLGSEYAASYGNNEPTSTWVNGNLSPHFPYAARIWSDAWQRHSGRRVDGVIALDPSAMAGLLAAAGPARLPNGTVISAANVVDVTEHSSYSDFPDTARRKSFFLSVAKATAGRLISASADRSRLPRLLSALHKELGAGRVIAWSAHRPEQRELQRRDFAGILPDGPAPFAGLVVNNAAGSKLDYYLDRTLEWTPRSCGLKGREVTVKVTLTNRAPAAGLPSYVTFRADEPAHPTRPGDNRLLVSYFATSGAVLTGATLDGSTALVSSATERGHPVFTLDVELPAGAARTITLRLAEPPATRAPVVLDQPLVRPLRSVVRPAPRCHA